MNNFLIKILVLLLTFNPFLTVLVFADSADDDMKDEQQNFEDFVKQFPDKPVSGNSTGNNVFAGGNFGSSGRKAPKSVKNDLYSTEYYNQASQSNWAKAQVMQSLATFAQSLAQTTGSSLAPQGAGQAQQVGQALSASSDPQFQQMGAGLQSESSQMMNGNAPGAEQSAQAISEIPPPVVPPSYTPTPQESALVEGLNTAIGFVLQAFFSVLGASLFAGILSALHLSGPGANNIASAAGSNAAAAGTGVVMGQNSGQVLSTSGGNMLSTSGAAVGNSIQNAAPLVAPPKAATNFNQTGAAPAGN